MTSSNSVTRSNLALSYLDYVRPREFQPEFLEMEHTIASLQKAVKEANGNPAMFSAEDLSEVSALDLIATISSMRVEFIHRSENQEEKKETIWTAIAPEWANWLAMDDDGSWFWYQKEPVYEYYDLEWSTEAVGDLYKKLPEEDIDQWIGETDSLYWKDTKYSRDESNKSNRSLCWDTAPEWANFVAMDKDGEWFWFHNYPVTSGDQWVNSADNDIVEKPLTEREVELIKAEYDGHQDWRFCVFSRK